ncbi:MAG: hypothetical protein ACOZBL_05335 [Patescibacteria group bacterium]
MLELAKDSNIKSIDELRARYNSLLQEKFADINKKYHQNLGGAEIRYEISRFKDSKQSIDLYVPKSELFDFPPKQITKDNNPQLF